MEVSSGAPSWRMFHVLPEGLHGQCTALSYAPTTPMLPHGIEGFPVRALENGGRKRGAATADTGGGGCGDRVLTRDKHGRTATSARADGAHWTLAHGRSSPHDLNPGSALGVRAFLDATKEAEEAWRDAQARWARETRTIRQRREREGDKRARVLRAESAPPLNARTWRARARPAKAERAAGPAEWGARWKSPGAGCTVGFGVELIASCEVPYTRSGEQEVSREGLAS
ncbi:hypothetical protein HPB50_016238 [Hyalomma asiaticum]|uniref:Uncharacterized protein n=1 Tax=Hyalomma asiaticum TaxID=266040 RepID=A0ACB7TLC7_HYAAI|nr:hypothetical protein HPB50_016238 [Hyalomma asiaticum]